MSFSVLYQFFPHWRPITPIDDGIDAFQLYAPSSGPVQVWPLPLGHCLAGQAIFVDILLHVVVTWDSRATYGVVMHNILALGDTGLQNSERRKACIGKRGANPRYAVTVKYPTSE